MLATSNTTIAMLKMVKARLRGFGLRMSPAILNAAQLQSAAQGTRDRTHISTSLHSAPQPALSLTPYRRAQPGHKSMARTTRGNPLNPKYDAKPIQNHVFCCTKPLRLQRHVSVISGRRTTPHYPCIKSLCPQPMAERASLHADLSDCVTGGAGRYP